MSATLTTDRAISFFKYAVLDLFPEIDCWVAGGAVRDFFANQHTHSDFDVFFRSRVSYDMAATLLEERVGADAVVFKNEKTIIAVVNKKKIQLVGAFFFDGPKECAESFDFTVCCAAVDRNQVYMHETFLLDLAGRRLVINKITFPLSTLQRLQKYIKYGFSICNGGLLEIAKSLATVDLTNPSENTFEFYPDGTPRFMRID